MLKTYRIIPFVFILFLFGFTLSTVAPVFAWDPSMGMRHPDRPCMKNAREKGPRFGCGPDMRSPEQIASDPYDTNHPKSQEARGEADSPVPSGETVADSPVPSSPSPSGGEVAELNARIAELEAENARLLAQQGAPADQSGGEVDQLNDRITELEVAGCKGEERLGECVSYVRSVCVDLSKKLGMSPWFACRR